MKCLGNAGSRRWSIRLWMGIIVRSLPMGKLVPGRLLQCKERRHLRKWGNSMALSRKWQDGSSKKQWSLKPHVVIPSRCPSSRSTARRSMTSSTRLRSIIRPCLWTRLNFKAWGYDGIRMNSSPFRICSCFSAKIKRNCCGISRRVWRTGSTRRISSTSNPRGVTLSSPLEFKAST